MLNKYCFFFISVAVIILGNIQSENFSRAYNRIYANHFFVLITIVEV